MQLDRLDLLRGIKYFAELDTQTLAQLRDRMHRIELEPRDYLCREGEIGDSIFVIERGRIDVLKNDEDNVPVGIAVMKAGDIGGELCLLGEERRSATLRAREASTVWTLTYAQLRSSMAKDPAISLALLEAVTRLLRKRTSVLANLVSRDIDPRFNVAVFDTKPYIRKALERHNPYDYALRFFEPKLSLDTVPLAAGFKVVCAFVNDDLDAAVIQELAAMDVGMVALRCAGFDNVDLGACRRHGMSVTRVPAYSPNAVAEHAVALIMALNRKTHRASNRIREGNFSLDGLVGFDLYRKTVGVIGVGRIGTCLARIMKGFGCDVIAYARRPDVRLARELGIRYVALDELYRSADIASLHVPLVAATRHLIDAQAIAKMKRGVMLINTGRGALVDTAALIEGLKSQQIGAAGLDVYENEKDYFFEDMSDQVVADDALARLTSFSNVVLTSHQGFLTHEALQGIAETTIENIREFELGRRGGDLSNGVHASGSP